MTSEQPYGLSLLGHYPNWWIVFFGTALVSWGFTALFYRLANRWNLLPAIRQRDVHTQRKPRVGGVAMWVTVFLVLLIMVAVHSSLPGLNETGSNRIIGGILGGMVVLLGFGLADDMRGLSPSAQFLGQFLAATAVVWGGVQAAFLHIPFASDLRLDTTILTLPTWLGGGLIYPVAALFSYFWIVIMINVMNFFDGLDGLTGSMTITGSAVLLLVCLRLNLPMPATLALITAGAAAGFLPWNWPPAKIFMGTVGSQLLGFLLGVIAIVSGAKVATAVLVLGIPVLDAGIVVIRRLLAGVSPFKADQRHLHHRLLKIGLSVPQVVLVVNAVAVIFGLFALRTQNSAGKGLLTIGLVACMVIFIGITYLLERKAERRLHCK